jgi:hypothetical protein
MDPDLAPGPDPTSDPTPFFIDFKDEKKKFHIFFSTAHRHIILSLKILFFAKILS